MQTLRTNAVILRRINYGEADRILTLLTRDYGKIALIAKGVRKEKSKLAGGIELMSESDISFIKGKGDVGTLVSTQLVRHFGNIHIDLPRMNVASEFLRRIDSVSEDQTDENYFDLVLDVFVSLNTPEIPAMLVQAWATMRLLFLLGEVINIEYDVVGDKFDQARKYRFLYEEGRFVVDARGDVEPSLIKFLRLLSTESPSRLMAIKGVHDMSTSAGTLLTQAYMYSRPQTNRF
jgi:DNA repair protein RecO (recombination protein O)